MMSKDILYPLRKIHGIIHEWILEKKSQFQYCVYLGFFGSHKYYVIGTPEHSNLGDSAIVLAEIAFLKKCGIRQEQIKEITVDEYKKYLNVIKRKVRTKDILVFPGGGNMGDQWFPEELLRRSILSIFKRNRSIIFPQTLFYSDAEMGRIEERKSIEYYNQQKNLTIVAREKDSYNLMKQLYPDTKILLTPDIVLSFRRDELLIANRFKKDVLLCFRNDPEQSMTSDERQRITEFLLNQNLQYKMSDMYSEKAITKENRRDCVKDKLQEFSAAKLVITDRLHGMVFAAIAGTPCIVFSNYNYKVRGTYEWIKYLQYIQFVDSVEGLEKIFPQLISMDNCEFDNTPLLPHFEKLAEVVKSYAAD